MKGKFGGMILLVILFLLGRRDQPAEAREPIPPETPEPIQPTLPAPTPEPAPCPDPALVRRYFLWQTDGVEPTAKQLSSTVRIICDFPDGSLARNFAGWLRTGQPGPEPSQRLALWTAPTSTVPEFTTNEMFS